MASRVPSKSTVKGKPAAQRANSQVKAHATEQGQTILGFVPPGYRLVKEDCGCQDKSPEDGQLPSPAVNSDLLDLERRMRIDIMRYSERNEFLMRERFLLQDFEVQKKAAVKKGMLEGILWGVYLTLGGIFLYKSYRNRW